MAYDIKDIGALLRGNDYPGRGIVVGKSADGKKAVFAYFIMGRSENSRNRIFAESSGNVSIRPFDESKVEDPSLIIYSPVRICGKNTVVTNGDQTDTICDFLMNGSTFEAALETRSFEPDEPNFTPRISGILNFENGFYYKLSILKSADASGSACNRFTFSYHA
ncbi:MAG: inosine monophosphate cyclohydrolase, partial [Clostridiales bacterium]|nr:inosine monophosphate cyclohydrolase [Clostridiales bacterium]